MMFIQSDMCMWTCQVFPLDQGLVGVPLAAFFLLPYSVVQWASLPALQE